MEGAVPVIAKQALIERLAEGLASGITVVTPNRRLALSLSREVGDRHVANGRAVWESPDILPFGAFVERLWSDAAFSERGATIPALLSEVQEQALWDQIVGRSSLAKGLLSANAAAAQCRDAWKILHAWGLRKKIESAATHDDARAFIAWFTEYEKVTSQRRWTDAARLTDVVRPLLPKGLVRLPASFVAFGFDLVTPQQERLFDALASARVPVATSRAEPRESKTRRIAFASGRDEVGAAARWARARLDAGARRIGIVVPDLARSRGPVARELADVMAPGRRLTGAREALPFEISLGLGLDQQPLVRDALLLTRLCGLELPLEAASRVVRSPFLGGSHSEQSARACADAELRRHATAVVTLASLARLVDSTRQPVPILRARLTRLIDTHRRNALGSRAPSAWARAVTDALDVAGFPGERALDSNEYQAVAKWHELLGELATLDRVVPKMSYREACAWLEGQAKATLFQPEGIHAPVQVLGVLESAGLEFDHLWVLGLTDEAWPMAERAQSLIPLRLQREAGVPQADANASLEFDRRLTKGWLGAANEVVVSHALAESDRELFMSPLIKQVPEAALDDLELPAYATLRDAVRRDVRLERLEDRFAPPIEQAAQPAGTSLFRDQSACPFRAFARHRLNARELEGPAPGLDARERGTLMHAALAHVWQKLGDKAHLDALSVKQRDALLGEAADAAIADVRKRRPDAMGGRFGAIERARLVAHLRSWLALEAQREDFTVEATEAKAPLVFGGVAVQARLDRMDRLSTGGVAVIDYKTGDTKVAAWLGNRPEEPQLPMYAMGSTDRVDAVVFARVKPGAFRFAGVARRDGLLPNINAVEKARATKDLYRNWEDLTGKWRIALEAIGTAYARGDASVDPRDGPKTCEICDQQTFCRVSERLPAGAPGEEEGGNG